MAGLGIGGAMAILSRSLLYRAASVCAFVGTLSFGSYGVSLLVNADGGNGSGAGNLLVGGFGFLLLFIEALLGAFGVIAWQTSRSS